MNLINTYNPLKKILVILIFLINNFIIHTYAHAQEVGFVLIKSDPSNAKVYINGKDTNERTPFQQQLEPGTYTFRLELVNYNIEEGEFTIQPNETERVDVKLSPDYGSIRITSNPDNAEVYLDGELIGSTPLTQHEVISGEHNIKIVKNEFDPLESTISVEDEQTTEKNYDLEAGFGTIGILAQPEADIYIDGAKVGNKLYTGRLSAGNHLIEARKEKHTHQQERIKIDKGEEVRKNFKLKPKTGILRVFVEPVESKVYLDGEFIGHSPLVKEDILVGKYNLSIEKEDYAPVKKEIEILDNKTVPLEVKLNLGKIITINSYPVGAEVIIDSVKHGKTPLETVVKSGTRLIKLKTEYYKERTKEINVDRHYQEFDFKLEKKPIKISLSTYPEASRIFVDGNDVTKIGKLNLKAGSRKIRVEKPKYNTFEATWDINRNNSNYKILLYPEKYRSKGGAIIWSLFFPGAGQAHLNRGGGTPWFSVLGYGLLGGSYYMHTQAVKNYDNYLEEINASDRASLKDDWKSQKQMSEYMLYGAGVVWAVNLVWTILIPNEKNRYNRLELNGNFDNTTKTSMIGLKLKITK